MTSKGINYFLLGDSVTRFSSLFILSKNYRYELAITIFVKFLDFVKIFAKKYSTTAVLGVGVAVVVKYNETCPRSH